MKVYESARGMAAYILSLSAHSTDPTVNIATQRKLVRYHCQNELYGLPRSPEIMIGEILKG